MVIAPRNAPSRTLVANGQPISDAGGRRLGAVVALRDVTASLEAKARLDHQSLHDALTGRPNRALFVDRVAQALERGKRGSRCTAVLFWTWTACEPSTTHSATAPAARF